MIGDTVVINSKQYTSVVEWRIASFVYGTSVHGLCRLWGAKLTRAGEVLANYIPLKRVSDSTYHIYDTVSKTIMEVVGNPL